MSDRSDSEQGWQVRPNQDELDFDLARASASMVTLRCHVPEDALTAQSLGTERAGNGVVIEDSGLILTIGYLVTEAETVWITDHRGHVTPGTVAGYDQRTGFGLVQALGRLDLPALALGESSQLEPADRVLMLGGGEDQAINALITARREFAGYWEYLLDDALFTAPAHPNWGGTAAIGSNGELLGIGSLQLEQTRDGGQSQHLNMIVPIDLLKPILEDLLTIGRANRPPRPWLGLYATEVEGKVVLVGMADDGPAQKANLKTGDLVISVGGTEVSELAGFFRAIWAQGEAGVDVPLMIYRDGRTFEVRVASSDRAKHLKRPSMH